MTSGHVLIVDDDDLNSEMMQMFLMGEGYTVVTVRSGEKALDWLKDNTTDVIMMDVRMGGMSGYETCAAIKADEKTKHIPVLMVTGFNEDRDIREAISAGVDDLLFKPIKSALMLLRVRTLMRMKKMYDELHA